jgi:hypothetical protein
LALLLTAGQIAANPGLGTESDAVRWLRQRALQALFSGLREGMLEVRIPLMALRDCPAIAPAVRDEIEERLAKVLGVVKARKA